MPTVDDLLNNTIESQICIIDPDTRVINVPACYKEFGVEADEKVNRIKFQCPKIVGDNIDLTTFNLYINYMNARGEYNAYLVDDVTVSGVDITFSWVLSRHVTEKSGTVNYIVCAKKSDETGVINEWNTKVATATVGVGLEATTEIEAQNADVIEQILAKISSIKNDKFISLDVTGATVGQTVKISAVDDNGVPTAWVPVDMGSGGGAWEQFYNQELSEAVSKVTITIPEKYRQLWLVFRAIPASGSVSTLDLRFSESLSARVQIVNGAQPISYRCVQVYIQKIPGSCPIMFTSYNAGSSWPSATMYNSGLSSQQIDWNPYMNEISCYIINTEFEADSKFMFWGNA